MSHMADIPLVILTGHRKSGTSLFHRLFDGLPQVNLYPVDISVLYAYFPCYSDDKNLKCSQLQHRLMHVVSKSLDHYPLAAGRKNEFMTIFERKIRHIDLRDKAAVITSLCSAWAEQAAIPIDSIPFIFKETSQSIFFDELKQSFPKLKMIALVRDPRDNFAALQGGIASYYSALGEGHIDALASLLNRARMDLHAAWQHQQDDERDFLAIKFEHLLKNTESTMRRVAEFLDIDFDPQLLNPQIAGQNYPGNNHGGKQFKGISCEHIAAWPQRISAEDAQVIEYWLADVMDLWGYERCFGTDQSRQAFARFYARYNCQYFFHDSFGNPSNA